MRQFTLAFGGLMLTAMAVFAQMADVDTDGDGYASFDELVAVYADVTEEQFAELDTDGDGTLSEEEMTAAMDSGALSMSE
ncbi:EF-hand domain-containing protein [Histidinibacterium aquaticum]|uniref:EF-hand domain-containing protein n=1 Tax=Histidinibacterium aquaticum TaxID=2613962 RepID=A0A5J5GFB3_9RHOB|nr:EF-hand domain-containing protein [Histidinibacterium aquaticum]KAA9006700.1 EF-hand domain-containing protein [Histidinibacterium aquaticum]